YTTFSAEIKPGQIIVNVVVINDGAGELKPSNLSYNVMYGGADASSFGFGPAGSKILTLDQGNLEQPMLYEVYISRAPNKENHNVAGIYNGEEGVALYKPYWPSGGGITTFAGDCKGTIGPEEVKKCTITFDDGDIKYGWGYTEISPGFYNEKMQPLTTVCTYKNRGQFYGDKLVKAPTPSPEDNIIGCLTMKTEAEYKAEAEAAAKAAERASLLELIREEISNKNSEPVQPPPSQQQTQTPPPSCSADTWQCGNWVICSPQGVQTRSCSRTYDCPSAETVIPSTTQYCQYAPDSEPIESQENKINVKNKIDKNLSNKLKGKILLQVENHGEAWYVNPKTGSKHYMANGDEAYKIMRNLGIGITNIEYGLNGKIIIFLL
ncbi:MAG: hypothetical protein V1667_03885, partial [bacterium]